MFSPSQRFAEEFGLKANGFLVLVDLRSLPLQRLLQHERETRTNLGEEGFSRVLFQALLLKAQPRP